jgi:hypothetical protein
MLNNTCPFKPSAVAHGAEGENRIERILTGLGYQFNTVAQTARYSDFLVGRTLVEVKNYGNTVPSTEVDKFYRDLTEHSSVTGMFISLRSKISKRKRFDVEVKPINGVNHHVVFLSIEPGWPDEYLSAVVNVGLQLANSLAEKSNHGDIDATKYETIMALTEELTLAIDLVLATRSSIVELRGQMSARLDAVIENMTVGTTLMKRTINQIHAAIGNPPSDHGVIPHPEVLTAVVKSVEIIEEFINQLNVIAKKDTTWNKVGTRVYSCEELPVNLHVYKTKTEVGIMIDSGKRKYLANVDWAQATFKSGELILPATVSATELIVNMLTT